MSVNYYDLLDVDRSASRDEIRAAWKAAVADLEPSDRRFRAYNSAAEVLLDDDRRRAYDATLPADDEDEATAATADEDEVTPTPLSLGHEQPVAEPAALEDPEPEARRTGGVRSLGRFQVPAWLLVLTAAVGGFDAWLAQRPSDSQVQTDTRDAQATAERAIVPILSYDYHDLAASKAAASAYFSPNYRACYDKLFSLIQQNAPSTQTVIKTQVVSSGVVRAESSDSNRVQVLVFVNRPTTNKLNKTPIVYHDEVTVTMVKSGEDWQVDNLQTQAGSGSSC